MPRFVGMNGIYSEGSCKRVSL